MQQYWKGVGSYGTVGLELALSVVFGWLGGRWLDQRLGTHPWLMLAGVGFGIAAGYRAVWRAMKRAQREAEAAERAERLKRKRFDERPDQHQS